MLFVTSCNKYEPLALNSPASSVEELKTTSFNAGAVSDETITDPENEDDIVTGITDPENEEDKESN